MHHFSSLSQQFEEQFNKRHFPAAPQNLYDAAQYLLQIGGKRLRPVSVLMGNELFDEILPDAYEVGNAIELFHNFTLVHDDIMDKAPMRRNMPTVHMKYNEPTALLAGDVMLVKAYEYLNKITAPQQRQIISIFNKTAIEVCEGQQMDMDFENKKQVSFEEYLHMISLKTSVLLAASLQMGALLGGAGLGNQQHIYAFGKKLGIAFQVQDDYLDAFGDPGKFGKQVGGDILSNKKTFLLIHALETATPDQKKELENLMQETAVNKVERVLAIYKDCKVDEWAMALKDTYTNEALGHLEDIAVISGRKKPLLELVEFLMQRDH